MTKKSKKQIGLSKEAEAFYQEIIKEYQIDDCAGLRILQTACEALDRMRAAQTAIEKNGVVFEDRYGQPRLNPACSVERDARAQFLAALKQLHLDVEPLHNGPGRPGGK